MVAYQQRGEGVMVKFRTPGEVLRWGGIETEVEWVEEAATHFMVWLEEGVLCGSGGGMLPPVGAAVDLVEFRLKDPRRSNWMVFDRPTSGGLMKKKVRLEFGYGSSATPEHLGSLGDRVPSGAAVLGVHEVDEWGKLRVREEFSDPLGGSGLKRKVSLGEELEKVRGERDELKKELGAIYEVSEKDEWSLTEDLKRIYSQEYDSVVYRDSNAAGVAARRAIYDLGVATGRSEAVRVQKELEKEVARATSLDEVASKLVADLDSLRMAIAPHMEEVLGVVDLRDIVLKREEMRLEADRRVASLMEEVRRLEGEVLRLSEEREELVSQVRMEVTPVVPEVGGSDIFPWLMGLGLGRVVWLGCSKMSHPR